MSFEDPIHADDRKIDATDFGHSRKKEFNKADIKEKIDAESDPRNIIDIFLRLASHKKSFHSHEEHAEIRQYIIDKLLLLNVPFEEWQNAYDRLAFRTSETAIGKTIVKKMVACATTFEHWRRIIAKRINAADYEYHALEKMSKLAENEEDVKVLAFWREKLNKSFDYKI